MLVNDSFKGVAFALIATLLWAGNFVVSKSIYQDYSAVHLNFWRWFLAFLFLLPFVIPKLKKSCLSDIRHQFRFLFIGSWFGMTVNTLAIYQAAHTTSATNQTLIAISAPVFVAVGSCIFFHQVLSRKTLIGVVLALTGISLLLVSGGGTWLPSKMRAGDLLILVSAASFAIYTLMSQKRSVSLDLMIILCVATGCAALQSGVLYLLAGPRSFQLPGKEIGSLLYFAIGPSILGYLFWNKAILCIGSVKSAFCYFLLPVFGALFASIFLGEGTSYIQAFSYVFIATGVFLSITGDKLYVRQYTRSTPRTLKKQSTQV